MKFGFAFLLLGYSAAASAESPAGWIGEQARCFDREVANVTAASSRKLTRKEARKAAARVEIACRFTYRHLSFTAQVRANMAGVDRYYLTNELLKSSGNRFNK